MHARFGATILLTERVCSWHEGSTCCMRSSIHVACQVPLSLPVLQVTHRLEELQWADTASYMEQGKIQFTGPAQEVAKYMKSLGAH